MRLLNGKIADKLDPVTDEEWAEVNEFNRNMVEDYLSNQTHLSPHSLHAYRSALKIFFVWVKNNLNNKNCIEIRKKEFLRYMNFLANRGLSEAAIKFKKSSVSALNKFIENFYDEDYPMFRNYVTAEMQVPKTGKVFAKEPCKNMCAFTGVFPRRALVTRPIRAAPAVCELDGPIMTGPRMSNTFILIFLFLLFIRCLFSFPAACRCFHVTAHICTVIVPS